MPASQLHENVFQAGLPRGEVNQLRPLFLNFSQQRRNGFMWLVDLQREQSVIRANRLHSR